ncbi:MAG: MBL fold metallo-hydrolase [Alphaproteobacteria bacterium]
MHVAHFYDEDTGTFTYVVSDENTKKCAIIDSVLNFDIYSASTYTKSADAVIEYVKSHSLTVEWVLDTHAHADHLTAAHYIKSQLGGKTAIGEKIVSVIKTWSEIFNLNDVPLDGSQFDHLLKEGEKFYIGEIEVVVMHTPGHTPACSTYVMGDCAFVGDTILMPHIGTARTDFPGGSARTLYQSIQKILSLPEDTKIYTCHDYPKEGDKPHCVATVAEHKAHNALVYDGVKEDEYVVNRNRRDAGKPVPTLLIPSIQVNIRAGELPRPESNGKAYLKFPLNTL